MPVPNRDAYQWVSLTKLQTPLPDTDYVRVYRSHWWVTDDRGNVAFKVDTDTEIADDVLPMASRDRLELEPLCPYRCGPQQHTLIFVPVDSTGAMVLPR